MAAEARTGDEVPDLLLATDPDADRVGIAARHDGRYLLLSGNEVGVLLLDFICMMRIGASAESGRELTMPEAPVMIKTIVTTKMAEDIASAYGVSVINVLTGFKFIGEQIGWLERKCEESRYIFGFEESYGYLAGSYVRDKDAVNAAMLICEMAAFYKNRGWTLIDRMHALYDKYGYYKNDLLDFGFEGAAGMERMGAVMNRLRSKPPVSAAGRAVREIADYMGQSRTFYDASGKTAGQEPISLPKSDVLEYVLEDGSSFIVRPSGTEPKLKLYISAKGATAADSDEIVRKLSVELSGMVAGI
jgi:phosphoglucomutase